MGVLGLKFGVAVRFCTTGGLKNEQYLVPYS